MDVNIDFLHVINPFWYLFHFFSVTLLAMLPQRKPKNLLKNHLTTLAKSNDRFGLNAAHTHNFYPKTHFFLKIFAYVHFLLYLCTLFGVLRSINRNTAQC